ncbi:TPA: hypothetical protein DIV48_02665 [Candidatus Kaiserbacteria bacterium]|nr:MAG: hypothetical protein UY93_C0002G0375 [Parcubacteria group bacterium GW2011_GWA1_56_13]KKW46080.1 MAG: hypothetical protein UY97_C0010G0003 [Parcubacteria group bacterium GW2011_GWB1_57_6]HCR52529.1 hypothetical protein [Candidatus Kaiserbacteria bacterium]
MFEQIPLKVPNVYFDKEFLEGNFLIPHDGGVRAELKKRLKDYLDSDQVQAPEHQKTRDKLSACIAAIDSYGGVGAE